jgi:Zn-dependent peptidase ImmA (M78 family)
MEYLEQYRPTPMESFIVDYYKRNHIKSPQDIDLDMFAYEAGIWIHYSATPSTHYEMDDTMYSVIIDDRAPWQQQRVELAHELGHCILHVGNQSHISQQMRLLQEAQADRFAFYALTPTFMIANCLVHAFNRDQLVSQLAYSFDVPEPFMDVRLQLLEQRLNDLSAQAQLAAAVAEASVGYDYSYRHPGNPNIELLVREGVIVGQRRRAAI